jgi:hypothetical protein
MRILSLISILGLVGMVILVQSGRLDAQEITLQLGSISGVNRLSRCPNDFSGGMVNATPEL